LERGNANATRATCQQQELAAAAPATGQQVGNTRQGNDNVGAQAPATPSTPQPHQQGNESRANRLRARDLLRNAMASKSTTLLKPTWELLLLH
jgi:hypothetical protein